MRSNNSCGNMMPEIRILSRNFGRIRLGWNEPRTFPSDPMPFRLNVNISCMLMTSSSMPVISEMLVTLRVPSLKRVICKTMPSASRLQSG